MHVRFPSELVGNFILFRSLLVLRIFFLIQQCSPTITTTLSYNPLSKYKHILFPQTYLSQFLKKQTGCAEPA